MSESGSVADVDLVIIGAGIAGIGQLYLLKDSGLSVRVLEAGGGVGGTWYWNRYPAARFDSESYSYNFFFSEDVLREWRWKEHFAGQPETEAYLNFVVDKFGLREHIRLDARVVSAAFDEEHDVWSLRTEDGTVTRARFVISATGFLSAPYIPDIPGRESFAGESHHTGRWPKGPVDLEDKRVALIGTGASGVQILPAIAPSVRSVSVYQRTPNWVVPLNNAEIAPEDWTEISAGFPEIHRQCLSNFAGFCHPEGTKAWADDAREARLARYEELYRARGFAKVFSNYIDLITNAEANAEFAGFLADKIRATVDDPITAENLIPRDHAFGMKRIPMDAGGYFEAYNRPNVRLVDLNETPILRITESGIVTAGGQEEVDVIVWATGFDAVTGALTRIDIVGTDGQSLKEHWADGPKTYLGAQCHGFPNLFMISGPHLCFGNGPRAAEPSINFLTELFHHISEQGITRVEAEEQAEARWTEHVLEAASNAPQVDSSWLVGGNIPGKKVAPLFYVGGIPTFIQELRDVVDKDFEGFVLSARPQPAASRA